MGGQLDVVGIIEYNEPDVNPFIYTALFHQPQKCKPGDTHYRDKLPKENDRLTEAYHGWTGDGLYFHHILLGGRIFIAIIVIISVVFANVWSAKKDLSAAYSVGQYLLALVPVVVIFVSNRIS